MRGRGLRGLFDEDHLVVAELTTRESLQVCAFWAVVRSRWCYRLILRSMAWIAVTGRIY